MVVRSSDSQKILDDNETHLVFRNYLESPPSTDRGYFLKAYSFLHNYFSTHGELKQKFKFVKKLNSRYFRKVGYVINPNFPN